MQVIGLYQASETRRQQKRDTRPFPSVLPNQWQGETDCFVGPFASRELAERYLGLPVDFGQLGAFLPELCYRAEAWYIEVHRAGECPAT
jgi:hypothetical protein